MDEDTSIQTVIPVSLAISNAPQEEKKLNCGSVVLTSSSCVSEVKYNAAEKKEVRKSGRHVLRRSQLDSKDMFQEELLDHQEAEEECPCLCCNEAFSCSEPGGTSLCD
jgi:hypothetical protein